MIRRNKIKNVDGELWVYSHHQCRKTLATRLLTEGASIQETSQILGHLTERTTLQYYEDIDKMKIAHLDRTLFEALFDEIQPEVIKAYTKDELNALKKKSYKVPVKLQKDMVFALNMFLLDHVRKSPVWAVLFC